MTGNSLLNISMISKEALRVLRNNLVFAKGVNRQYDDQFANAGAKIGSVMNIRKPVRFTTTSGAALSIQDVADQSVALTLDTQQHVDFQFTSKELTLNIDEFSDRYVKPAIAALANKIDYDGFTSALTSVWNSVGVPGTTPATALVALQAGQKLDENACPMDDQRTLILNPAAQAAMIDGLKGLFNTSDQLKSQYEKGVMGKALGFTWKMSQNVQNRTTGDNNGDTILVNTPSTIAADGDTTIVCDGFESGETGVLLKGDIFTIANVNAVNPQNRQSTGSLMQFVVTANLNSTSVNGTIAFSPALQSTGPYQNIDALPADNAAVTPVQKVSADGVSTPQNLAYHKDAFVLGMADLVLPNGVDMAARASDPDTGLALRIVRAYDINNDRFPCRIDVLYGWKAVYPELACKIQG